MAYITLDVEGNLGEICLIGYRLNGGGPVVHIERPIKGEVNEVLQEYLKDPSVSLRGHNIKYDALCLVNWGYDIKCNLDCTRILSYLSFPNEPSGLKYLVKTKLRKKVVTLDDISIKVSKKRQPLWRRSRRFEEINGKFIYFKLLKQYNSADVVNCDLLYNLCTVSDWYIHVERPLLNLLFSCERRGAYLDRVYIEQLNHTLECEIKPLYEKLTKIVENPNSTQQIAKTLTAMGLDLSKLAERTPKGAPKIDKMFLKRRSWEGNDFCQTLLNYKRLFKIKGTYLESFLTRMDNTGRIHGSFNQAGSGNEDETGTATGRLTSTEPNLQNIPARTTIGKAVRKGFTATPGYVLFDFDLKQIEPRLIAHYSQSPKLLEAYAKGLDTHGLFGADIFGKKVEDLSKMERFIGKTSWLATTYGCWYKKLLYICEINSDEPLDIDITKYLPLFDNLPSHIKQKLIFDAPSEKEARELYGKWMFFNEVQENFRKKNPEIMSWCKAHAERTKRLGYIKTIGGRIIRIEGLDSRNEWGVKKAEREAVNYQIQGSAADIMKIILIEMDKFIFSDKTLDAHLIAVVHDEVLGEFKDQGEEHNNNLIELIKTVMCRAVSLNNVNIDCDGGILNNWGDKK